MNARSVAVGIVLVLVMVLGGCAKSTVMPDLELSRSELLADQDGNAIDDSALQVIVESNSEWSAQTDAHWLAPNMTTGTSRTIITIRVEPNFSGEERTGVVAFTAGEKREELRVTQQGGEVDVELIVYEIPVIFHVMYNEEDVSLDKNEEYRKHRLSSKELEGILEYVNRRFGERREGELEENWRLPRRYSPTSAYFVPRVTNVKFVMADTDPEGKTISPIGVQSEAIPEHHLDPYAVLNDKEGGRFRSKAWPIGDYINVFIFPFTRGDETVDQITLGVSHFPKAIPSHPIEGLAQFSAEDEEKIKNAKVFGGFTNYNHAVVINADAFERRVYELSYLGKDLGANTLTHELGHYLGLFHTFSEVVNKEGEQTIILDSCEDTDYCMDTPTYNRARYVRGMQDIIAGNQATAGQMAGLLQRTDCGGARFEATNIMDYNECHSDEFTVEQIARMREVLYFSYTVPGIKVGNAALKALGEQSAEMVNLFGTPRTTECHLHLHQR